MRVFVFYILLIISLLYACEKQYDWDIKSEDEERLVVDALITNELKPQKIILSRTNPDMNQPSIPLSGAEISVMEGSRRIDFTESDEEPGIYYSTPFQVVINNIYRLIIQLDGIQYLAISQVTSVSQLDELAVDWDETKNMYRYRFNGQGKPSMTEIFYDWSVSPAYCDSMGSCNAQETYYVLDNVDINAIFGPEKQVIYFPQGTILIRRKYGLTPDHQQFIRSLLLETDWRGGVFDVLQGNVASNISNGALGYFATCTVISDTTVVD
jgi:hypothetical protein